MSQTSLDMVRRPHWEPRVYVILVNWNGWRDTIECLESVFQLNYSNCSVIVCDNGSTDGSLERIASWAIGELVAGCGNRELEHLTLPTVPKPISFRSLKPTSTLLPNATDKLLLVQNGSNLGFAGGNNVGLRLALSAGDLDYAWLLNNDTVVHPDALTAMVQRMEQDARAGMCGSTLLYYYNPQKVQAAGGFGYSRWTGRVRGIGQNVDFERMTPPEEIERKLGFVSGASMLARKEFLKEIGLLNEQYFLYFEEIDWASRSKGRFTLAYSPKSLIYHKDGSSSGTLNEVRSSTRRLLLRERWASPLAEYYTARNRILFTRTHVAFALPTVIATTAISGLHRLLCGKFRSFGALASGLLCGLLKTIGSASKKELKEVNTCPELQ